jgi:hypothetical protein
MTPSSTYAFPPQSRISTWESLPGDIRYLILRTFCTEIISDFKGLGETIRQSVRRHSIEDDWGPRFEWSTPPSLTSFLSAITACREFNHVILKEVKLNGRSTLDLLKERQLTNLSDLNELVIAEASKAKAAETNLWLDDEWMLPEPRGAVYLIDIGYYYKAAGCFWNNSDIAPSLLLIFTALEFSTRSSSQLLLPYLGPWIQYHSTATPVLDDDVSWETKLRHHPNPKDTTVSSRFNLHVDRKIDGVGEIGVVKRTTRDKEKPGPHSLAELDLAISRPGQWWVFFDFTFSREDVWEVGWTLVNYEQERMYVGPNASESLVWKGKPIWDVTTCRRLKTLQQILDYGDERRKSFQDFK